uniref:von Willebrand factor type A n=1 Tax=Cyanothece sp. (strain PCC 7425 / ATCC 29141) TaxID=395961 RepID=B8HZL3_CYAP4
MTTPQFQLLPLRAAVASDQPTTLDVLVKIIPPVPETRPQRPPLNLGLVIDRSGSMQGAKMEVARQAACFAVEQLLPSDRLSVTIFDDRVECPVPSTLVRDKATIIRTIQGIHSRGSTALHDGWVQGGIQVSQHLNPAHLNRVILLSDGLANVGETNPDAIAQHVHGLAQRGVSTSTMGIGEDYGEDLLEAMARSGAGSFYHIERTEQLAAIFQAELQGLMGTLGQTVSLGIEPKQGVVVVEVLNDFEQTPYGRYKLPNLVVGNSIEVVVRLKVPPLAESADLCQFRLAWDQPQQRQRQVLKTALRLPVVSTAQLADFPLNEEVQQQVALLMAARARQEAIQQMDRGNYDQALHVLQNVRDQVACMPASPMMQQEVQALSDLEEKMQRRDYKSSRKQALYEKHYRQRSRKDL